MSLQVRYEYWDSPDNTHIKSIEYKNTQGELHRPWQEGPAWIEYWNISGNRINIERYFENGQRHRPRKEGPAVIWNHHTSDNHIYYVEYHENGIHINL